MLCQLALFSLTNSLWRSLLTPVLNDAWTGLRVPAPPGFHALPRSDSLLQVVLYECSRCLLVGLSTLLHVPSPRVYPAQHPVLEAIMQNQQLLPQVMRWFSALLSSNLDVCFETHSHE
jgi:hypothetical protein